LTDSVKIILLAGYTYKQTKLRRLEYIDYRWKQAIATSRIPRPPSGDIEAEVSALAGKCLGLLL
jgi:hypothetical protein